MNPSAAPRRLRRRFRRRWILALGGVAALAAGSAVATLHSVRANADNAALVNISGRQRMLSQRIALTAEALAQGSAAPGAAAILRESLRTMRESHDALTRTEPTADRMDAAHRELYFGSGDLDARVRAFLDSAEVARDGLESAAGAALDPQTRAAVDFVVDQAVDALLPGLDSAVATYQELGEARIDGSVALQTTLALLLLSVLVGIGAGVFRPMETRIDETLATVREQERRLVRARQLDQVALLSATIAHDLKNLSGVARGNLQLAREEVEAMSGDVAGLDEALRAVAALDGTSRRLLALGRGDVRAARARFHIASRLRSLEPLLGASARPAEFALTIAPELARASVEAKLVASEFDHALLNLVGNSGEALLERSGGRIELRAAREKGELVLTVEDNGPGVPEELGDTLFEPFVSGRPGEGGTGLGLHQVKRFALESGGSVDFESGPGGTAFTLRLPIAEVRGEAGDRARGG